MATMNITINSHKDEVLEELNRKIGIVLEEWGLVAERYAKDKAPVATGRMRNSITHQVVESEQAVYIGTDIKDPPYPRYVELGTSRQKPQPFLRPAIADHLDEYSAIAKRELQS